MNTHTHAQISTITHASHASAECALPQGSIQWQAREIKEAQVLWRHQLAELITAGRERKKVMWQHMSHQCFPWCYCFHSTSVTTCVCVCIFTSCPGVWPHHSAWSPRGYRGAWPASWRPHSQLGSHWPECPCSRAPNAPDCPNHTPPSQTARLWGWHRCGEHTCVHTHKYKHTQQVTGLMDETLGRKS